MILHFALLMLAKHATSGGDSTEVGHALLLTSSFTGSSEISFLLCGIMYQLNNSMAGGRHLSSPVVTCRHLSSPVVTCRHLSSVITWIHRLPVRCNLLRSMTIPG